MFAYLVSAVTLIIVSTTDKAGQKANAERLMRKKALKNS